MAILYRSLFAAGLSAILITTDISFVHAQTPLGSWEMNVDESDDMDPWGSRTLSLSMSKDSLTIVSHWQAGRYFQHDSMTVSIDGETNTIPIRAGKWMNHVYLGVFVPPDASREVTASWSSHSKAINVTSVVPLETSQADTKVEVQTEYRIDATGNKLTLTERRSSRTTGPLRFIFERQ